MGKSRRKPDQKEKKSDVKKVGKKHAGKTIGTIVFYSLLVLMILGAVLVRSSSDGSPKKPCGIFGDDSFIGFHAKRDTKRLSCHKQER